MTKAQQIFVAGLFVLLISISLYQLYIDTILIQPMAIFGFIMTICAFAKSFDPTGNQDKLVIQPFSKGQLLSRQIMLSIAILVMMFTAYIYQVEWWHFFIFGLLWLVMMYSFKQQASYGFSVKQRENLAFFGLVAAIILLLKAFDNSLYWMIFIFFLLASLYNVHRPKQVSQSF